MEEKYLRVKKKAASFSALGIFWKLWFFTDDFLLDK